MKLRFAAIVVLSGLIAGPALAQSFSASEIIATIGTTQFMKAAGKVDRATSARVVRLSILLGARTAGKRMARAEALYERDLDYLHSNLTISPIVMQAIRGSGFDVESIVALTIDREGSAILYADDL